MTTKILYFNYGPVWPPTLSNPDEFDGIRRIMADVIGGTSYSTHTATGSAASTKHVQDEPGEAYVTLTAAEWAATLVELDELRELRENTLLALGVNPMLVMDGMEDQSIAYLIEALKERVAGLEAS